MYRLRHDPALGELITTYVEAEHALSLPGVECPTCAAAWATTGSAYPSVDVTAVRREVSLEADNVPWEEYVRRREIVRSYLPPDAVLEPGTGFGPLLGRARGRYVDFAFAFPWTVLLLSNALDSLKEAGITGLVSASTNITMQGGKPFPYLELEAHPHLRLAPESIPADTPPPCSTCGRWPVKPLDPPVFLADSVPRGEDVVRGHEMPTWLFISDRFVEAARTLGLRGATFTEVKLV